MLTEKGGMPIFFAASLIHGGFCFGLCFSVMNGQSGMAVNKSHVVTHYMKASKEMKGSAILRGALVCVLLGVLLSLSASLCHGQTYADNETQISNQDPLTETRRSDHFRVCFGHYDRDGGMSEQLAQGNLQMYEKMWNRWITEMGFHDINSSDSHPEMGLRKTNFNFLMTWDDGGGGGSYMSSDANGFAYCMANPGYCSYDPYSGATPHEFGHVWEGTCAGFNGTNSSGMWWEATANWMELQFLNGYPTGLGQLWNGPLYPCHGRDFYDSWAIWETALNDSRYGAAWVNSMWTNATADQQVNEFILDRMVRLDASGSADKTAGMRDLWGDMARRMVTADFSRQRWFAPGLSADDGSDWLWANYCRTPLIPMPGNSGWYRPSREHTPMEYGLNVMKLNVTASTTVSCNFQPICDPVRQSDFRACLVAVSNNGDARYSSFWNVGTNSITLSTDESKLYLVVAVTPKPMVIDDPMWSVMTRDAGLQFPYRISFTNATPTNIIYPIQSHTGMHQHSNGLGWVADTATVDATAYVGPNAQVLDSAQIKNYARIDEYAVVRYSAQVRDNAVVSGHALVSDTAQVYGNAKVRDWAVVCGDAQIYENAMVCEQALVPDTGNLVHGSAICKGMTYLYAPSNLTGSIIMDGDSANGNGDPANGGVVADHGVHFGWQWGQNHDIFAQLPENGYQYCGLTFERDNPVFACDQFGVMHGFLMNGCKSTIDSGGTPRGGYVLALNGTNQYVELPNSVNDFKDMSIAVWVKWTGTASDQKIWSMGDGSSKIMYLTPKNSSTSKVRFSITDGTTTQFIDGAAALGTGWTHVVVTFSGNTGTLYVNGAQAGQNTSMTLDPDSMSAALMENCNYIGRDTAGNYFQGSVDDFRAYNKTLSSGDVTTLYNTAAPSPVTPPNDTTAPTPNAETWLVNPMAISDSAISMSGSVGTDASNYVAYYFTCTAGGGHDSGWIASNHYTDVGLNPSTQYTYTVKMQDKYGNTTTASSALAATTQTSTAGTASFAYGPVGISDTAATMTATKVANASGLTEYKFTRNDAVTSGWQASPSWTNTGLTPGAGYTYTVQLRDGRGHTSTVSSAVGATARDMAAPILPITVGHWSEMPYATIDNCVSMTATTPTSSDATGVQYYFHCTAGGAPDSAWQDSPTYKTTALADGTYSYQYKVRDKSAQLNASGYSSTYSATITPTTGYHTCTFAQLTTLPDDYLVTFSGTIVAVNTDNYLVKDTGSSSTITVKTAAYGQATVASSLFKPVTIKGHLYTYSGTRLVTYAAVTPNGGAQTCNIYGRVTRQSDGTPIMGATVYLSLSSNASANAIATATTDRNGNYGAAVCNGTWYLAAGGGGYNVSADQVVTVNGANIYDVNFSLVANSKILGKVTNSAGGAAISGATVYFSTSPNASVNPAFTTITDSSGNYSQQVQNGTWYVCASAAGFLVSADTTATVSGSDVSGVNRALTAATPVAYYQFENNVNDTQGAYNGTAYGSPTYVTGNVGSKAIQFNGSTQYVSINRPVADNWTISFFVKTTQTSPTGTDGWWLGNGLVDGECPGYTNDYGISYLNSKVAFGVSNSSYATTLQSVSTINSGNWVHVACTRDSVSGQMKIYINGTLETTGTGPTGTNNAPSVLHIGNLQTNLNYFNGAIDQLKIYNNVLAADSIRALANEGATQFNYTITASAGTGGTISPSGTVNVASGGSQAFTITPNVGYAVSQVTVDSVNQGAITSYTFSNVTANHTISATFATTTTYTITAFANPNGTMTPSGYVIVNQGANQTFTITPNSGYQVSQLTVDGVNQGANTTYTFSNVQANHTFTATFTTNPATLVAFFQFENNVYDSQGPFDGTAYGSPTYVSGKVGSSAIQFDGSTQYVSIPRPVSDDWTIAFFVKTTQTSPTGAGWYNGNGLVDGECPGYQYDYGVSYLNSKVAFGVGDNVSETTIQSTSTINSGNWVHVACTRKRVTGEMKIYVNGVLETTGTGPTGSNTAPSVLHIGNLQTNLNYFNGAIDQLKIYNAVLSDGDIAALASEGATQNTFTITASAGTGGTITPSGAVVVNQGANQTFNIAANSGYSISQVTVDSVNQGPITTYTFTNVQANHTISATFVANTYTITASAGTGGTINPSGAVVVNQGANQSFTIAPSSGYMISSVTVDSVNVGCVRTYTFTNVQANHTIAVAFATNTDLVAYYKFDETSGTTAYDSTANAKNGTLYGSCTWAAGKTNNAVSIPGGSSDYVGLPTGIVSGLTNFTIVAWVKLTSVSTNMRIFDFGTSTTNYMELTPKHSNSSGKVQFYIRTSSTTKSVTGAAALPTGSWQHVAVTLSGQTLTLYVQGAQVGQITNCTINPNSLGSTTNNYIGKSQTTSHPHLNGLVDGFRIYNRALSGTEISTLYNGGAGLADVDVDDTGWDIIPAK